MKIEVLSISPSRISAALAHVKIRLTLDEGHQIDIDDIRILRNNRGEVWTALPTYAVKSDQRNYRYEKTVDCSKGLWRKIDDSCQEAYEKWVAEQKAGVR